MKVTGPAPSNAIHFLLIGRFGRPLVLPLGCLIALAGGCTNQATPATYDASSQSSMRERHELASTPTPIVSVKDVDAAVFPWRPEVVAQDWNYLVIHHTATESGSVESIHRVHRARRDAAGNPWKGIGYHFVIGNGRGMEDGAIEPTFRWQEQLAGAHAGDGTYNRQGIGICLVGNFQKHPPTARQLTSLKKLIADLAEEYRIAPRNVLRHGEIKATDCPGKHFPMAEIVRASTSALSPAQHVNRSDR